MKSKDIDLIFWESLNYKGGVGFFVPALVLFFEVSTGESGHIKGTKNGTSSAGTKNPKPLLTYQIS